ncbi:MAG: transposase [Deltaproteobacteria bacterium]|nr:transposase [Deltaproteobacteria bacterium]
MFEEPLTSQLASKLFASIPHNDRISFFKKWISKHPLGSLLAYDVTSFSTYVKGIVNGEFGYNRDGERLPQINLGCFVSESNCLPVFYVTYPGSIVDKSHLSYMMAYNEELGISNVGFVLDRGFCATANVQDMNKNSYDFIIGVEKRHKTTRMAIDLSRDCIESIHNRIESGVFAFAIRGCFYGTKSTMHIYYDRSLADNQVDGLFRSIENEENLLRQMSVMTPMEAKRHRGYCLINLADDGSFTFKRDKDKMERAAKYCGFYCLLTNTALDSSQILAKYRRKDVIEKSFDDLKNHISMKRMRTHKTDTTDGKLFCSFIALIVASELDVNFKNFMNKKSISKEGIIREMEKICVDA